MPSGPNLYQCLMGSLSFVVEANSSTRYMLINIPNTFHTVSPFLLQKLLKSCIGEIQNVKKLRSGDLLVQVDSKQASTPVLPEKAASIKAGYINCKLRPYIPNPLRCFKCQMYGHSQQSCRGTDPVCGKCAESGHEINVCTSDTFKCRNCSGPHAASSKSCPIWIFEKEVVAVKMKRNITFPETRQIVKDRTPKVGVFYSSTVQMQPKISNNTSEINSLQLPVYIPLSTLPSKFFTAPTATTSMKNNSPKKSTTDIVKNKKN
ncbi:hypothetical protein AVEN_95841-1 [Araneus ventricosus]|uniref:CCHC-type domain-containing protein n=1 Tax=Araneus ventricosus TaxID=182803 RepID=A0A4Y2VRR3_ARAVE|nr:hypothetical protein AVEN_95841-1 [Araneus ventricosus]